MAAAVTISSPPASSNPSLLQVAMPKYVTDTVATAFLGIFHPEGERSRERGRDREQLHPSSHLGLIGRSSLQNVQLLHDKADNKHKIIQTEDKLHMS
jgi:hypothetical protein